MIMHQANVILSASFRKAVSNTLTHWDAHYSDVLYLFLSVGGLTEKGKFASFVLSWNFPSSILLSTDLGKAGHLTHFHAHNYGYRSSIKSVSQQYPDTMKLFNSSHVIQHCPQCYYLKFFQAPGCCEVAWYVFYVRKGSLTNKASLGVQTFVV